MDNNYADGKNGNGDTSKAKDKSNDTVGKLSDNLLRLVEETDKDGNICYCVETVGDDELVYSSISKAQAFSFCEGYRAANGDGASKPRRPKDNSSKGDNGDDSDKSKPAQTINPANVQRKRMVF